MLHLARIIADEHGGAPSRSDWRGLFGVSYLSDGLNGQLTASRAWTMYIALESAHSGIVAYPAPKDPKKLYFFYF